MAHGREFEATLEEIAHEGLYDQVAFTVPGDAIPGEAMAWVKGTINGHPFEANTSPAEDGAHRVFIPVELRETLGVRAGDRVRVRIEPPEERPEVPAPDDLREAIAAAGAGLEFERLTVAERRDYAEWVEAAEGELRAHRVRHAVEGILDHRPPREVIRA